MDPLRRKDIADRLKGGEWVSPAEKSEFSSDMTEKGGYYGSNAVDALTTTATGVGLRQGLRGVPGAGAVSGFLSTLAGDVASGKGVNAGGAAKAGAKGGVRDILGALSAGVDNLPGMIGVSVMGGMLSELLEDQPNYSEAAAGSTGSSVGGLIGGLLGGLPGAIAGSVLGGSWASSSITDGILGDMFDTRANEGYRDKLEDSLGAGLGQSTYGNFSSLDPGKQLSILEGGYGPGRSPSSSALQSNTSSWGSALSGMFGGDDDDGNNVGGAIGSSTGTGGGYNMGGGEVSGL